MLANGKPRYPTLLLLFAQALNEDFLLCKTTATGFIGNTCMKKTDKLARRYGRHLRVPVLAEEEESIKQQANQAGLSVSAYLRKIGLGYPIHNIVDYQSVDSIAKINGDLGRLGGLLKLWLTNDEKLSLFPEVQMHQAIIGALKKIEENQEKLRNIISKVLRQ